MVLARLILISIFIFKMASPVWAAADLEKMEALYIQKIINYVDWPVNGGNDFVIAVDGQDELFVQLEQIFRTPVLGKTVKIVRYDSKETIPPARILCLFTSRSKIPSQAGLLVITQNAEGIPDGAVINFILEEGKLRFDINNTEAQKRDIRINARLLKLARTLK